MSTLDLYAEIRAALRTKGHYAMPAECIMAVRDSITSGDSLDYCLARRGLTHWAKHLVSGKDALIEALETVKGDQ